MKEPISPSFAAFVAEDNPLPGYSKIKKHYTVKPQQEIRSDWFGTPVASKSIKLLQGSVMVLVVMPDDWTRPDHNLKVQHYVVSEDNPRLQVPAGCAISYKAIEPDSKFTVFSDLTQEEEWKFEREYWYVDSFF